MSLLFCHFILVPNNNEHQKTRSIDERAKNRLRLCSSFLAYASWIWHLGIKTRCFNRLP
tara:strand:- start:860 stop:1036 length:177 start_codon:yes stop_codon:yes gene_type:complete